jgi:hypothetical protein
MRLTGLLALRLFVLIVFFAAPAASYAQTSSAPAIKTESADANHLIPLSNQPKTSFAPSSEQPLVAMQPLVEHNGDLVLREPSGDSSQETSLGDDYSCFTMRSYIMARDDKDSDATHLVRKVKCTPARKFSVKSADVRVQSPEKK